MRKRLSKSLRYFLPAILIAVTLASWVPATASFKSDLPRQSSFSQAVLPANADIVKAGGYVAIQTGAGNNGMSSANQRRDFFLNNNESRIRQNGTISYFVLNVVDITAVTNFYLGIWRKDGATWDKIHEEDFIASLAVSTSLTLTPSAAWSVLEGDYISIGIVTGDGTPALQLRSLASQAAASTYFVTNDPPSATDYNWSAGTAGTGVIPVHVYMQAPQVVFIGDSLTAGHPANYSFIENSTTSALSDSMPYQLSQLIPFTYQNMGIGGQSAVQQAARFTADAINLKPRFVVTWPMANNNMADYNAWIAAVTTELDACVANSIIPIFVLSGPETARTTPNWQTYETWESNLKALVASNYPTTIIVQPRTTTGQFRAGGDAGNLWDIIPAYDSGDGVHFNATGYGVVAQAIADANATVTTNASAGRTFNGTISPSNHGGFEYGLTASYGYTTSVVADSGGVITTSMPSTLIPGATYHYRAYANSLDGVVNGSDVTFVFPFNSNPSNGSSTGQTVLPVALMAILIYALLKYMSSEEANVIVITVAVAVLIILGVAFLGSLTASLNGL